MGLAVSIAVLDALTPLGVADSVLYVIPVVLALFSKGRWDALLITLAVSLLNVVGVVLSPPTYNLPLLLPLANRTFALVAVWLTFAVVHLARRTQAERHRAEAMFQSVFDHADECIVSSDDRGTILLFNHAAETTFGYAASETIGQNIRILMPEPDRSQCDTYIANFIRTGQPGILGIDREVVACRKDGSTFPAELEVSQFFADERRHFIGIVRDVTARRQIEEQLRRAQRMESIGRMAGGIAHDFNNLLTPILGYADILRSRLTEEDPAQEEIEEIRRAADRAAGLTRQMLAFGRRQVMRPKVLDINTAVLGMKNLLSTTLGEDIDLMFNLDRHLWKTMIDPTQIEQVLLNLALNARDAMPAGGKLTIETSNENLDAEYAQNHVSVSPGPYVALVVSDTGFGMDDQTLAHIFEPFFTLKKERGTGLGLASVYGIVKQSGGYIWVYSEPQKGATFKLYFPRTEEEGVVSETAVSDRPKRTTGTETVLLVEDNQAVRGFVARVLSAAGYTVLQASIPREALDLSGHYRGPIHLVVCDVILPDMNGRDLSNKLLASRPALKVLFMSGFTENVIVYRGVLNRGVEFLEKPFTPTTLLQRVRELLDRPGQTA